VALALAALVAASLAPVAAGAALLAAHVTVGGVLSMGTVMAAFLLVVAAYSALISAFGSDRGQAAGVAGSLRAYEPGRALETGGVEVVRMALLLGIAAGVAAALCRLHAS